jgi:hypothetical protein
MSKKSFVIYKDWKPLIAALYEQDRALVGELFMAAMEYQDTGAEPDITSPIYSHFSLFKAMFDKDAANYEATCKKNKENGSLGGRPPKAKETQNNPVGFSETQNNPQKPDNDNDNENDKDNDLKEKEKRKRTTFTPPTLEEVTAYCKERNNGIDPESFIDFYTAKGWKIGKESMKDWKASVRTWEKRKQGNGDNRASFATNKKIHNFQEREMDDDYFRKLEKICLRN